MLDLMTPVSMDKCGEVDAVNGAGAPIRETDRTSPEDLWEITIYIFFCRLLCLFAHFSISLLVCLILVCLL